MSSTSKSSRRSSPPKSSTADGAPASSSSNGTSKSTTKRLIQELSNISSSLAASPTPIERLAPIKDDNLLHWEAVISGKGLGGGYDAGRWLLDIVVPDGKGDAKAKDKDDGSSGGGAYPFAPPKVRFVTRICASNVQFETGEICLDLLKTAWTPAYTLQMTVEAIWQMLAAPGVDSPLNVDVAALIRGGDSVGAEGLVRWSVGEWKYDGR